MRKIKIAVIDTGADVYDPEIREYIKHDKNLQLYGNGLESINDFHGHGTMCIKTILSVCDRIEIYPIKVFDDDGKTNSFRLVETLQNLLDSDIEVINISASTVNRRYEKELNEICNQLNNNGKKIVCAHHNLENPTSSMPTRFKSVIGITGSEQIYKDEDFIYDRSHDIQIKANSKECFIRFRNDITHFGKNSRAAALISGIVTKIISENPGVTLNELEEILIEKSSKSIEQPKIKKYNSDINRWIIAETLVEIVNHNFASRPMNLYLIEKYSLFNNFTSIGRHNAYDFLVKINEEFGIDLNYQDIFLYHLENIDFIVDEILRKVN